MSWEWLVDKHNISRLVEKSGEFVEEPYENNKAD